MTCTGLAKWGYRTNATLVRNTRLDAPVLAHWHEHLGLIRTFLEGDEFPFIDRHSGPFRTRTM